MVPRVRIELTTPASSKAKLDYIIIPMLLGAGRLCRIIVGTHLLVSTPFPTLPPTIGGTLSELGSGLS